ncbi:hypothetical protein FNF29_01163 [Cafeteria roenbergensis]|uniref:HD/PDEase domain-containing protein n=1 Tax=Cafeteria roenbergensis TaxID=33653 RepID=A0A5A8CVZ8_CAFRO|nr:hypothetical protein FNF29_01163 [Cafeteria roenbergensis]|eukprot:KAA0156370.1 hypothetical protein FNF29_01163 [Cafeteria roenbergensis]
MEQARPRRKPKLFNDAVHGHIPLEPLCVEIVDTPEFQRLRDLKQLGGCYLVFPTASHNRFEHSLGVCYLSGRMIDHLADSQPELKITDEERLCVRIAGLCHDLGHGPLSHAFESTFLPAARARRAAREAAAGVGSSGSAAAWKHEWASVRMLEHLVRKNGLLASFRENGLTERSLHLIQELILGDEEEAPPEFEFKSLGRRFLYDIVANKANGIDTDKGDYFMRDAQMLGMRVGYDWGRMLKFARVADFEGAQRICFQEKEAWQLYELFHSRYTLHKRAYQHRVGKAAETMLVEALVLADDFLTLPGAGGTRCRVSDCVEDMEAYAHLSDSVFALIETSDKPEMRPAQELIGRVKRRQLYPFVGQIVLPPPKTWLFDVTPRGRVDAVKVASELVAFMNATLEGQSVSTDAIVVDALRLNYGQGASNPMENVGFISRKDESSEVAGALPVAFRIAKDHVSALLPNHFEENTLRVFCKDDAPKVRAAALAAFQRWCARYVPSTGRSPPASSSAHADSGRLEGTSTGFRSVPPGDPAAAAAGPAAKCTGSPERRMSAPCTPANPGSAPATAHASIHRGNSSCRMSPIFEDSEPESPARASKRPREGKDESARRRPAMFSFSQA